ncbi:MAG: HlyD family efflux transporter periplasmic adaptor subunit [Defluviitaleaceae bacterium]|nr:HlyD family efflux transporter periplasmic adaptor subunit [Defluviitaleaceae bacterium]
MNRFDKKMKTLVGVSAGVLVVVLVVVIAVILNSGTATEVSTTTLEPITLNRTVLLRGAVESLHSRDVSTNLGFIVEDVLTDVGQVVQAGQILAVLDTADLQLEILQMRAEIGATEQGGLLALAETALADAMGEAANPMVEVARLNLEASQQVYDNAVADLLNDGYPTLVSGRYAVNTALERLEDVEQQHESNAGLLALGLISVDVYNQSGDELLQAQIGYAEARAGLVLAEEGLVRAVEVASAQLDAARFAYEASLRSATVADFAEQDLTQLAEIVEGLGVDMANEAQLIALLRLERQLEESVIRSPISGTVTVANVRIGSPAHGVLFTIEDTNSLRIVTSMREYDATRVRAGMGVDIRTDATGDGVFRGVVVGIDPAATRSPQGDVEFGAEISVDPQAPLMIGMNARLNVILEERHGVFAVPFDAVATDEGGDHVFVVANGRARRVCVAVGLEADFLVEIASPDLVQGAVVINNASNVSHGMEVSVAR